MPASPPFVDESTGALDTEQIIREAIPLTRLVGFVGVVALVPFAVASIFRSFRGVFIILTQFVLAVGSGIVLLYLVARARQLAEESGDSDPRRPE